MKAVIVRQHGGPEVLEYAEQPVPETKPGEVRVRIQAIGINRRDAFIRAGIYPRALPLIPGVEAAGIVDEVGPGVSGFAAGDRVAYYVPDILGAYAEYQAVPAHKVVKLPAELTFEAAAALFDHGLTAHYLSSATFPLREGHRVLVHAAAGGVGSLLTQMARRAGATVYGTVSTPAKAELIRRLGAEAAILYRDTDFVEAIKAFTHGRGVDVVYDSVGKDTLQGSMRCLRPRGTLVLYGQSSGPVNAINPGELADAGSLFFTRPHLAHHTATPEELNQRSQDIFAWYLRGEIAPNVDRTYRLSEVAEAHRRLEDRSNAGKILLIP